VRSRRRREQAGGVPGCWCCFAFEPVRHLDFVVLRR
jgi:hypothetical protein